jgi:hypothetical protein
MQSKRVLLTELVITLRARPVSYNDWLFLIRRLLDIMLSVPEYEVKIHLMLAFK